MVGSKKQKVKEFVNVLEGRKWSTFMQSRTKHLIVGAAIALAGVTGLANQASARLACDYFGDCWHTNSWYDGRYDGRYGYDRYGYRRPDGAWYRHHRWDRDYGRRDYRPYDRYGYWDY